MMDSILAAWVSGLIELNKFEWMLGAGEPWNSGDRLKLLFAGYNGTRNTGSDVRVEEMLRQVRRVLGAGRRPGRPSRRRNSVAPGRRSGDFFVYRESLDYKRGSEYAYSSGEPRGAG